MTAQDEPEPPDTTAPVPDLAAERKTGKNYGLSLVLAIGVPCVLLAGLIHSNAPIAVGVPIALLLALRFDITLYRGRPKMVRRE